MSGRRVACGHRPQRRRQVDLDQSAFRRFAGQRGQHPVPRHRDGEPRTGTTFASRASAAAIKRPISFPASLCWKIAVSPHSRANRARSTGCAMHCRTTRNLRKRATSALAAVGLANAPPMIAFAFSHGEQRQLEIAMCSCHRAATSTPRRTARRHGNGRVAEHGRAHQQTHRQPRHTAGRA